MSTILFKNSFTAGSYNISLIFFVDHDRGTSSITLTRTELNMENPDGLISHIYICSSKTAIKFISFYWNSSDRDSYPNRTSDLMAYHHINGPLMHYHWRIHLESGFTAESRNQCYINIEIDSTRFFVPQPTPCVHVM